MSKRTLPATIVEDIDEHLNVPGAIDLRTFHADSTVAGAGFICPCGCGQEGYLPFMPEASPSWEWNGDMQRPTLTPSILQRNGCRWHGYLRNGVWEWC